MPWPKNAGAEPTPPKLPQPSMIRGSSSTARTLPSARQSSRPAVHPMRAMRFRWIRSRFDAVAQKRLIISIFDGEADAHAAAAALKDARLAVDEAVAVFALDESGELKTHKTG